MTHLASFYCIATERHKSMCRPAQEGPQDAQDLVRPADEISSFLVCPADEK